MILLNSAKKYLSNNLAVLPASATEKRPVTNSWKQYQEKLPTELEVSTWFSNRYDAICVLTGPVSGNLECIDFDNHGEAYPKWANLIDKALLERLVIEQTPSGGYHVFYRSSDTVDGNQKLATGLRNGLSTTLIETRGTGGLVLIAPSNGYSLIQNSFDDIPLVTTEEHECLLNAARACNEQVKTAPVVPSLAMDSGFTIRPGDDYSRRGNFIELLLKHGWTIVSQHKQNTYFRRPGKTTGQSASFDGNVFYVFSTNAYPFDAETGYSPYQAYTLLEHDGNYTASAKALLELGFGVSADPMARVDISAITSAAQAQNDNQNITEEFSASEKVQDPGPLPYELMDVPGFINALSSYTTRTAPHPNPVLSFVGALTMLSMLTGRKFCDKTDLRTNIYWVALADSGTGKDHPRKVNFKLAETLGMLDHVGDSFSSGEGLEDALFDTPCMLFQTDEMDCLMNNIKNKDARAESLNASILKLYGEANSVHCMRVKAKSRNTNDVVTKKIINPHFVLFGTAVPQYFYNSMTNRVLENGLIARCMIVEADERSPLQTTSVEEFPAEVLDAAAYFRDMQLQLMGSSRNSVTPITIGETPEAEKAFAEAGQYADQQDALFNKGKELVAMSIWRRSFEKLRKLAMLRALSRSYENPLMTEEDVLWARKLVEYLSNKAIYMANSKTYVNSFDEMVKRTLEILKVAEGRIRHSQLLRKTRLDKDSFKKLIETLIERGEIEKEIVKTQTRTGVAYQLVKH